MGRVGLCQHLDANLIEELVVSCSYTKRVKIADKYYCLSAADIELWCMCVIACIPPCMTGSIRHSQVATHSTNWCWCHEESNAAIASMYILTYLATSRLAIVINAL